MLLVCRFIVARTNCYTGRMHPGLYFLLFLLLTVNAPIEVKLLVQRVEAKYRSARTLQATFLERYTENGRVVRVEAGTAYFRRPGKMRWEYQSPEKNLFLVDGKSAWFYVPADHTVTRVPAKESADWRTPLALLAGEMKMSRICERILPSTDELPEIQENVVLSCELRGSATGKQGSEQLPAQGGASAKSVFFEVAKNSGILVRISVRDPGGVGVEFHFADWQFDPPVGDALFRFVAPPGVAIVNGELSASDAGVRR
jgi:outer membrane lipoprotein carrier protein